MVKPVMIACALVVAPALGLSGCATGNQSANETTTSSSPETSASLAPGTERLSTQLKSASGTPVANATLDFANGFATVTVETVAGGILTPGFHGLHIHSVGKCEANSTAPTGGAAGNFNSAGGHFQVPGHTNHPASGDLTSLEVRSDGSALLTTTTDAFTAQDLLGDQKTALIIHEGADNFGNIPTDRYQQKNGATGPDEATMSTGDSGKRVACGVIQSASASTTTSSTTTGTTTPTTTVTEAPVTTTSPTTTATPAPTTSTSTVTVTAPTLTSTPTGPPSNPMQPGTTTPPPGG
jgi:Cu-Zn family superoxide dismutase